MATYARSRSSANRTAAETIVQPISGIGRSYRGRRRCGEDEEVNRSVVQTVMERDVGQCCYGITVVKVAMPALR